MRASSKILKLSSFLAIPVFVASCAPEADSVISDYQGLVGTWLITETTRTIGDSTWVNESPQPGLYIFSQHHFSLMLIPGDSARVEWPGDGTPAERLAAFENFVADAGSYEATDSVITMSNIIAKLPWAMNLGGGGPYRYRLDGDTLTLSFGPGWLGESEITYRLVRLE
jgi:hypothetical protein